MLLGLILFLGLFFNIWGFPLELVFHQSPCWIGFLQTKLHVWHHKGHSFVGNLNVVGQIIQDPHVYYVSYQIPS